MFIRSLSVVLERRNMFDSNKGAWHIRVEKSVLDEFTRIFVVRRSSKRLNICVGVLACHVRSSLQKWLSTF